MQEPPTRREAGARRRRPVLGGGTSGAEYRADIVLLGYSQTLGNRTRGCYDTATVPAPTPEPSRTLPSPDARWRRPEVGPRMRRGTEGTTGQPKSLAATTRGLYLGTWSAPSQWCNRPCESLAGFLYLSPAPGHPGRGARSRGSRRGGARDEGRRHDLSWGHREEEGPRPCDVGRVSGTHPCKPVPLTR